VDREVREAHVAIRALQDGDVGAVLELNRTEVPRVGPLDAELLARLRAMPGVALLAVDEGRPVGFAIALEPGADYASPNYRFFQRRGGTYLYVDRVVVSADARRRGVASALYDRLEAHARAIGGRELTCEVNVRPPNPESLAFHLAREFVEVGRHDIDGGRLRVVLLARRLDSDEPVFDDPPADPLPMLEGWIAAAASDAIVDPTAMVLATTDPNGAPDARVVLCRGVDEHGLRFFTNRHSPKARQLEASPSGAAVLYWRQLRRQVRVRGAVSQLDDAASDAYFASRPRDAQLGAWASAQSEPLDDHAVLQARIAELEARFDGREVTRPPHWGGYRLGIEVVEFWRMGDARLHERLRYVRKDDGWRRELLQP
jgi:pyridoxamine 5'-phosphate oxidase